MIAACERNQVDWFPRGGPCHRWRCLDRRPVALDSARAGRRPHAAVPRNSSERRARPWAALRADAAGARSIGAWTRVDLDAGPLAERGFQRGWAPHWMTARVADVAAPADPRVALEIGHTRVRRCWPYAARPYEGATPFATGTPSPRWTAPSPAGPGRTSTERRSGAYDMAVWPAYRRRRPGGRAVAGGCLGRGCVVGCDRHRAQRDTRWRAPVRPSRIRARRRWHHVVAPPLTSVKTSTI